ncbi:MAG: TlpA family protein disulfide reductase [Tissierellia bacterium]|nr:TlpA family protein disulfide reductase [Tissierellia bacterium]
MTRRILIIAIVLVLVGGLYYYNLERDKKLAEDLPEENIIEAESFEEETVEKSGNEVEEAEESVEGKVTDLAVGKEAPNFTLTNLEGEEVSLEDFRGKIVLLNFWATWCVYCDAEMPDLQKLHEENEDLVVLAVDVQESKEEVEEYIKKGGYDFPVVLDTKGEVAKTYLVTSFPRTYFIDKDGILLGAFPGMLTYDKASQILDGIRQGD